MQFNTEEISEIIWSMEGSFPREMDMADYLNMIDELKAYKRIVQQMEDDELASTLI